MKFCTVLFLLITISLLSCKNKSEDDMLFSSDFEGLKSGKLSDYQTKKIWAGSTIECGKKDFIFYKLGITPHPHFIANKNNNNFLKVFIPENHYGPITGAQWNIPLLPTGEYYFSYKLKFDEEFDFVKGGKLPGLAGGIHKSGRIPNGFDGWSARMMYWENGKLSFYVYYPEQSTIWGERLYLKNEQQDTLEISRGEWHNVTQRVKLNSPGKRDGVLQAWFDGQEAYFADSILFRMSNNLNIDHVSYSVFMGGDDISWAPSHNQYIYFDDFHVSPQAITP